MEPVTGPAQLRWPWVGRLVHDPSFVWLPWEARSVPAASGRLQAGAAMGGDGGAGQDPAAGRTRRCHGPRDQQVRPVLAAVVLACPDPRPGWGVGWVSDRAAAKAKTQLNVALVYLDGAARLAREAGLDRPADTLARLARDATEALAEIQAARQPTAPVEQAAGGDEQGAAS